MLAVRIVCAWDAIDKAREIERLLEAETYVVTVATGLASLADLDDETRGPEVMLFVWSESRASPYVRRWLEASPPEAIVELRLGDHVPELEHRREDPIDFTSWKGVRGGECWKELDRRLKRIATEGKPRIEPVVPAIVLASALGLAFVAAAGVRVFDHGSDQAAAAPSNTQTITAAVLPPAPIIERGGISPAALLIEPESSDDVVISTQPIRMRPLPRDIGVVSTLAPFPALAEPNEFHDRSLIDALLGRD